MERAKLDNKTVEYNVNTPVIEPTIQLLAKRQDINITTKISVVEGKRRYFYLSLPRVQDGCHFDIISKFLSKESFEWFRIIRSGTLKHQVFHSKVKALTITSRLS